MKFTITFKTPDALDSVLNEQDYCDAEEQEEKSEKILSIASKFIKYGEYVNIEFDTDAGTATVVPIKQ